MKKIPFVVAFCFILTVFFILTFCFYNKNLSALTLGSNDLQYTQGDIKKLIMTNNGCFNSTEYLDIIAIKKDGEDLLAVYTAVAEHCSYIGAVNLTRDFFGKWHIQDNLTGHQLEGSGILKVCYNIVKENGKARSYIYGKVVDKNIETIEIYFDDLVHRENLTESKGFIVCCKTEVLDFKGIKAYSKDGSLVYDSSIHSRYT